MGFLMGALTLLASALITGGVGPWLPYQMFTAGWIGLSAPLCRPLARLIAGEGKWREVVILALFGGIWGLLYGAIMNIWFWPFVANPIGQSWEPGIGIGDILQRYALFYLATSLLWDAMRLAGNMALILAFGLPVLRALRRFHRRFTFSYRAQEALSPSNLRAAPYSQSALQPATRGSSLAERAMEP
jgi:energy-coupling factor transport system substrate-specific component